ncbi:MAG TPA: ribonuclease E/G, partial [Armatimonadota bacterium]|nr:ribonuclease E/G [Armatimonadota bacterium]
HAPAIIHKDLGIVLKTIRDLFGSDVDRLVINDREEYEKIVDTLAQLAPDLVDRVSLHEDPEPLFIRYNIEEEIDRLLRRKVWLRNGAYLLLDTTEALTTIDVNTGKFVGTSSLAETILKTNLDAVDEIARQLRLRDIGGMIVLDFIDMAPARDRQLVMRALENAFKKDRTRTKIAHISPLGLVEMTRKRTAENVTDVMTEQCPYCQGRGRVWSAETMAIQIEREIQRMCATQEVDAVLVHANPEVAAWLIGPEGESVERMERLIRRPVYIRARHEYHVEKHEVIAGDMMELERQMLPFHGGQVVDCLVTKVDLITPPRSAAWVDGYFVDLANGTRFQGGSTRVRLTDVRRSFAMGEPVAPSTAVDRSEPI